MGKERAERSEEEAIELALARWTRDAVSELDPTDLRRYEEAGVLALGEPSDQWVEAIGRRPKPSAFYEIHFYLPAPNGLDVERSLARCLVSRKSGGPPCEVIWGPRAGAHWFRLPTSE